MPETLVLDERWTLESAGHELLVETRAVGVSFIETDQRQGTYPVERIMHVLTSTTTFIVVYRCTTQSLSDQRCATWKTR